MARIGQADRIGRATGKLAKLFGHEGSATFVNGVLDRIASELAKS